MFAFTLFFAAALSFLVQPLLARQLLPLAGGSTAVWNTCLIFFQATLLLGYRYAHALQRFPLSKQIALHGVLLTIAAVWPWVMGLLAPSSTLAEAVEHAPVLSLLKELTLLVGVPSVVLSSTAPLLQAWFGRPYATGIASPNPFPLYAASNVGSMVGLLAYPFAVEPYFTIGLQRQWWCIGYGLVAILVLGCGVVVLKTRTSETTTDSDTSTPAPTHKQFVKWMALAGLMVSLLACVTTHLTTDIAPMPLLWVVPLAIYLLTFIITFSQRFKVNRKLLGRVSPMVICFVAVALLTQATEPMLLVAAVHLVGLFVLGLLCHGELAQDQPHPRHLTTFYFAIALGGVLGGCFNAIVAPIVFAHVGPLEYPLALVFISLVRPGLPLVPTKRWDFLWPVVVAILALVAVIGVPLALPAPNPDDEAAKMLDRVIRGLLMFGIPIALCFALVWRPVRFSLCILAVLLLGFFARYHSAGTLKLSRNFYGTLRVSEKDGFIYITHGTTNHGMQMKTEGKPEPAMYYHRNGPVGLVFKARPGQNVAVVGLGCGAMASYAKAGQQWTFFEIDPGVVDIARDDRFFTFLKTCEADVCDVVLGDARQKLAKVPDNSLDVLALDAFSSDAVPSHLLTREAYELYFRKLKPDGRLLMHLSNRYLDLPSLAGRGLHAVNPELILRLNEDSAVNEKDKATGKMASTWLLVARKEADIGMVTPYFQIFRPKPGPVWTDDYAPLKGVWKGTED